LSTDEETTGTIHAEKIIYGDKANNIRRGTLYTRHPVYKKRRREKKKKQAKKKSRAEKNQN